MLFTALHRVLWRVRLRALVSGSVNMADSDAKASDNRTRYIYCSIVVRRGCDRKNCHEPAGFKCIPVPLGVGAAASAKGRLPEGSRIRA
jgi:hypothetical protein